MLRTVYLVSGLGLSILVLFSVYSFLYEQVDHEVKDGSVEDRLNIVKSHSTLPQTPSVVPQVAVQIVDTQQPRATALTTFSLLACCMFSFIVLAVLFTFLYCCFCLDRTKEVVNMEEQSVQVIEPEPVDEGENPGLSCSIRTLVGGVFVFGCSLTLLFLLSRRKNSLAFDSVNLPKESPLPTAPPVVVVAPPATTTTTTPLTPQGGDQQKQDLSEEEDLGGISVQQFDNLSQSFAQLLDTVNLEQHELLSEYLQTEQPSVKILQLWSDGRQGTMEVEYYPGIGDTIKDFVLRNRDSSAFNIDFIVDSASWEPRLLGKRNQKSCQQIDSSYIMSKWDRIPAKARQQYIKLVEDAVSFMLSECTEYVPPPPQGKIKKEEMILQIV